MTLKSRQLQNPRENKTAGPRAGRLESGSKSLE
jgi:hypothetical protein